MKKALLSGFLVLILSAVAGLSFGAAEIRNLSVDTTCYQPGQEITFSFEARVAPWQSALGDILFSQDDIADSTDYTLWCDLVNNSDNTGFPLNPAIIRPHNGGLFFAENAGTNDWHSISITADAPWFVEGDQYIIVNVAENYMQLFDQYSHIEDSVSLLIEDCGLPWLDIEDPVESTCFHRDPGFSLDGLVALDTFPETETHSTASASAIDSNGIIYVLGGATQDNLYNNALWSYNPDGTANSAFNGTGVIILEDTTYVSYDVITDQNDNVFVSGQDNYMTIYKFTPNGLLDTTFGNMDSNTGERTGILTYDVPEIFDSGTAWKMAFDNAGRLIVAGDFIDYSQQSDSNRDLAVWRYLPNGDPDTTFNPDGGTLAAGAPGVFTINFQYDGVNTHDMAFDLVVDDENSIYVTGQAMEDAPGTPAFSDMLLIKLTEDGRRDMGFGMAGFIRISHNSERYYTAGYHIALDADNNVMVAGLTRSTTNSDWKLMFWKYNTFGFLDMSFGELFPDSIYRHGYFIFDDFDYPELDDLPAGFFAQPDGSFKLVNYLGKIGNTANPPIEVHETFKIYEFDAQGDINAAFNDGVGYEAFENNTDVNFRLGTPAIQGNRMVIPGYIEHNRRHQQSFPSTAVIWNYIDECPGAGAPGGPVNNVSVEYMSYFTATTSNTVGPNLRIVNNGTQTIDLSQVELRYYYQYEPFGNELVMIDDAFKYGDNRHTGLGGQVSGNVVSGMYGDQDRYVAFTFTAEAGTLAPGAIVEFKSRIYKEIWSDYDQSGDYSFGNVSQFTEWDDVTMYVGGIKVWGFEPGE